MDSYKMTHINYKDLKERMSQILKGFWKVQSIHKLPSQPRIKINNKEYLLLKTIKNPKQTPSFISFCHEEKNTKKIKKCKSACESNKNIFITSNTKRKIINRNNNKNQDLSCLFNKIYGKFTYEPSIYNEFQMFYLKRNKVYKPRKFKEVIKDCIAMNEYNNYLKNIQRSKSTLSGRTINNKLKIKTDKKYCNIGLNVNNKNIMSENRNKKIEFNDEKIFSISRLNKSNKRVKNNIFPII